MLDSWLLVDCGHLKGRVATFLLCVKRLCKTMPRDIRQMIVARLARAEMTATHIDFSVGE